MALLTDEQAINTRGWMNDLLTNRSELELTGFEEGALGIAREEIAEYELGTKQRGGVPFQVQPKPGFQTLQGYNRVLSGEENPFPEDVINTPDNRADAIGAVHMASIFGKSQEEIQANFPEYKGVLMEKHGTQSFPTALKFDIDARVEKFEQFNRINQSAQVTAAKGASLNDSITEFLKAEGITSVTSENEGVVDQYIEAFNGQREIINDNRELFDNFTKSMEKSLADVEVFSADNLFSAIELVADLPDETRAAAMIFAQQNIKAEGSFKRLFEAREGQLFRGLLDLTPRELIGETRKKIADIEAGKELFVRGTDKEVLAKREARGGALGAAFRMSNTERDGILQAINPITRRATDAEKIQRIKDAQLVGKVGKTMLELEGLMQGKLSDTSNIDNAAIKWVTDNITYPFATMSADLVNLTTELALGNKISGIVKLGKVGKTVIGGAIAYNSSQAAIKREHFNELVQKHPDMDAGAAYDLSTISGGIAAIPDAALNLFVIGKLPGVGKLTSSLKNPKFASQWLAEQGWLTRFTVETFSISGLETMTEVGQALTLDVTQKIYASYNSDIPDVDLNEQWAERWKEAPEIALAMLPVAILGGGGAAFIKPNVVENMVNNEDMMSSIGFDTEVIADIVADQPLSEKIAKFQAAYDPVSVEAAIDAKVEKGDTTLGMVSPEVAKQAREAQDASQDGTREEPAMVANRDEQGNIIGYNVKMPGVDAWESYQDVSQARQRVEQWHDEKPPGVIKRVPAEPGEEPEPIEEELSIPAEVSEELQKFQVRGQQLFEEGQSLAEAEAAAQTVKENVGVQASQVLLDEFSRLTDIAIARPIAAQAVGAPAILAPRIERGAKIATIERANGERLQTLQPSVNQASDESAVPEGVVALNKAQIRTIREKFGLSELEAPVRVRFEETLQSAKAQDLDRKAMQIAQDVIKNPNVINADQQAAMVIHQAELENQIEELSERATAAFEVNNKEKGNDISRQIKEIQDQVDTLTTANSLAGTQLGRALASRRIAIEKETFKLVNLINAATAAKKGALTDAQKAEFQKMSKEIKAQEAKVAKLEKALQSQNNSVTTKDAVSALNETKRTRSAFTKKGSGKARKNAKQRLKKLGYCVN